MNVPSISSLIIPLLLNVALGQEQAYQRSKFVSVDIRDIYEKQKFEIEFHGKDTVDSAWNSEAGDSRYFTTDDTSEIDHPEDKSEVMPKEDAEVISETDPEDMAEENRKEMEGEESAEMSVENTVEEYPEDVTTKNRILSRSKKIVLCFDGSGNGRNDFEKEFRNMTMGITNILKIHLLAGGSAKERDSDYADIDGQHSLYTVGLGADKPNNINGIVGWIQAQQNAMMKKLKRIYQPGDQLYMFGFSRGAAAAREFVAMMNIKGIRYDPRKKPHRKPTIKFIGLFDCVSSEIATPHGIIIQSLTKTGIFSPRLVKEKNGVMASNVEKALHIIGLDDPRMYSGFGPTMLGQVDGKYEEIWFPGTHGNIGGSWKEKTLGDVCLKYMLDRVEELEDGLTFKKQPFDFKDRVVGDFPMSSKEFNKWMKMKSPNDNLSVNWENGNFKDEDKLSYRKIGVFKNNKFYKDGVVKVHKSINTVFNKLDEIYTKETPYNRNLLKANFVVVDDPSTKLPEETKKLRETLTKHAPKDHQHGMYAMEA